MEWLGAVRRQGRSSRLRAVKEQELDESGMTCQGPKVEWPEPGRVLAHPFGSRWYALAQV